MIATAFWALWAWLVALGPWLEGLGGAAVTIGVALWEIAKIYAVLLLLVAAWEILFDRKGRSRLGNLAYNITVGAAKAAAEILADVLPSLTGIATGFVDAFTSRGGAIHQSISQPIADLTTTNFARTTDLLKAAGESTKENALDQAGKALGQAFGFGIASAGTAAAFEAAFPEKLNVLNGVAPMLASMAGFGEVSSAIRDPLYRAAFGKSAEYHFNNVFKPELPTESDAVKWYSRGLITPDELREIFAVSGLKEKYERPYLDAAYRPAPPFILSRIAAMGVISDADLKHLLEFNGLRPNDIHILVEGFAAAADQPAAKLYQSALMTAAERGTVTDADLVNALHDLGLSDTAIGWTRLAIATRKLEQLDELYRKSVDKAYEYGLITDADYVPHLLAIGIAEADADAHYALASVAKSGKALLAGERLQARAAALLSREAIMAALAQYHSGQIPLSALGPALIAAGMDAGLAGFAVTAAQARTAGAMNVVYGLLKPRVEAEQLRADVSALSEQVVKKVITPSAMREQLLALGIGAREANALVARAAAEGPKEKLTV